MGNSASKAAKTAAGAAKRQYPTRIPPQGGTPSTSSAPVQSASGPSVHPKPHASSSRDQTVNADAFDPQLGAALRSIGPVRPAPTYSNSSVAQPSPDSNSQYQGSQPIFPDPAANPTLAVLDARQRLAQQAEAEFEEYGKKSSKGRSLLDVTVIRQMIALRDEKGMKYEEIDQALGLQKGVAARLGRKGIVSNISGERSVGERVGDQGPLG